MVNKKEDLFYVPETANYLVVYNGDFEKQIGAVDYAVGAAITPTLGIIAVPPDKLEQLQIDVPAIIYVDLRAMAVLQDTSPNSIDNINGIKLNPYLNLTGRGVIAGIIDSGIDYLNQEFIREDGTSRIVSLWDQSINPSDYPNETDIDKSQYIGVVYDNNKINKAISAKKNNENPYSIVPSIDTIGHGTKCASIIGARGYNPEIQGIAHDCDFIVVKLYEATRFKKIISENNMTPPPVYNISEVVGALEFLNKQSKILNRPMAIFIGVGINTLTHDGDSLISRYITTLGSTKGVCIISGVGNEGIADGHCSGNIPSIGSKSTQELNIPKEIKSLSFGIWLKKPNRAAINIISPVGEETHTVEPRINKKERFNLILTNTQIDITFYCPEYISGQDMIYLNFSNLKPGIWKIELTGNYITDGKYDIWLPPQKTLPDGVKFLTPDPTNTIQVPSTAKNVITVAYLNSDNALVPASGKSSPYNFYQNPDLATVGTNIMVTSPNNVKTTITGSSAATAVITGACALILQWGIVDKNDINMYTATMLSYLRYGATRPPIYKYPSYEIGLGFLNLVETFNIIAKIYPNSTTSPYRSITTSTPIKFTEYYYNRLFFRVPQDLL